ncbi:MAG: tryptophan synthase subunit alpha [Desulfarculus sp.]|nr:tryptophan synthase subunit alpha [Pseudomonadota bacterium]MBV1715229.1 tryptophan synthase subunit alpha [Desulfarculus sp.]MBU4574348.1 tryptophan synthase subunit alpha [Pseudomonadota bacterium]MBU4598224.1 tryptophan synthase subunit alpha [Pseudomonadota bacterium]MBV1739581.1 tryptophan synthase subunit alpha [Desulfarculus sp.]
MKPVIREKFAAAAEQGRAAFVPYVTGGFPNADTCLELITALDELGSEVIEVGLPFSDPLADGPTIQLSSQRALEAGATPAKVLATMERAAAKTQAALVAMTYVNPVLAMGYEEFAKRASGSGVSGVIIPDLPPEEAGEWLDACQTHGLDPVFMAAPGTPMERLDRILAVGGGFLYYVSMDGVTGTELELPPERLAAMQKVRARSSLPVAVGFGVATPAQAKALAPVADGVVVGSALVRQVHQADSPQAAVEAASRLAGELRQALVR